jgi:phage terminase large subunit-like protein
LPRSASPTNSTSSVNARLAAPAKAWAPAWWTPRLNLWTDGPDVADFAATLLHVSKGRESGGPLEFRPWQRWLIDALYERRPDGRRRYRRALIGLARKNGKSLLGSAIALEGLVEGGLGQEVYAAAGDRQQARIVFGEAKWQVQNSPALSGICKVYRDAIELQSTGSVFRVLSADAKLQQGLNPSLVIFDEVHVQPNDDLWDALTLGSGARVDPLVVGITTAGHDLETLCGRLYAYGKQVAQGTVDDPSFGFWWWEAPERCPLDDQQAWAAANPNLAESLLDVEDMESSVRQTQELAFRRYRLNQWTRTSESWLPAGAWDACEDRTVALDRDAPFVVGVDMANKHDTAAVVAAQVRPDGRVVVESWVWRPDGERLDVAAIEAKVRELHRSGNLSAVVYDPAYFERSAQALEDDGVPMVEFPQSAARMVPACGHAYEQIVNGKVAHNGDPVLTDHVLSAAPRVVGEGWRLSKGRSSRKIDACIALVMALDEVTRSDNVPVFIY